MKIDEDGYTVLLSEDGDTALKVHAVDARALIASGYTVPEQNEPEDDKPAFDFAVIKDGSSRATKVFDEEQDALDFVEGKNGYTIEKRAR